MLRAGGGKTEAGGETSSTSRNSARKPLTFDRLNVSALVNSCLQQTRPRGSELYKRPAGAVIDRSG